MELSILLKWYSLNPKLHGRLWNAQSDAADLRVIDELRKYLQVTNPSQTPEAQLEEQRVAKQQVVDEARALLKEAGRDYGKRVAPTVLGMVLEIVDVDPGHAVAARQTYIVAYRNFSPWVHSEAASFKSTTRPISPTHSAFVGDWLPISKTMLRLLAASMLAYCIEVVSELMGLPDRKIEARQLRNELVDADAYDTRVAAAREAHGE